jgi:hypothetical protein
MKRFLFLWAATLFNTQGSLAVMPIEKQLSPTAYVEIFKKSMMDMVENMQADESVIAQYISPKYSQWVDGKQIDYKGFIQHMAVQKQHLKNAKVRFLDVIAQNNVVSSIHEVKIIKKDGTECLIKVIGHMTYEGNKLLKVDELTYVIQGSAQDKKLGSIQ